MLKLKNKKTKIEIGVVHLLMHVYLRIKFWLLPICIYISNSFPFHTFSVEHGCEILYYLLACVSAGKRVIFY